MEGLSPIFQKSLSTSLLPDVKSWAVSFSDSSDETKNMEATVPKISGGQTKIQPNTPVDGTRPYQSDELQSLPPRPPRRRTSSARFQNHSEPCPSDPNLVEGESGTEIKMLLGLGDANAYYHKTPSNMDIRFIANTTSSSCNTSESSSHSTSIDNDLVSKALLFRTLENDVLLPEQKRTIAAPYGSSNSPALPQARGSFLHLPSPASSSNQYSLHECVDSCHYDAPTNNVISPRSKSPVRNIPRHLIDSSPQFGIEEADMTCLNLHSPNSGHQKSPVSFCLYKSRSCSPQCIRSLWRALKSDNEKPQRWSAPSHTLRWLDSELASRTLESPKTPQRNKAFHWSGEGSLLHGINSAYKQAGQSQFESIVKSETRTESLSSETKSVSGSLESDEEGSTFSGFPVSQTTTDTTRPSYVAGPLTDFEDFQEEMDMAVDGQTSRSTMVSNIDETAKVTKDALQRMEWKPEKVRKKTTARNFEDRLSNNGCPVGICSPFIHVEDTESGTTTDSSLRIIASPSIANSSFVRDGQNYEVFLERNKILVVLKSPPTQGVLNSDLSPLGTSFQDVAERISPPSGSRQQTMESRSPPWKSSRCADVQIQTTVIQHESLVSGAMPNPNPGQRRSKKASTRRISSKTSTVPDSQAAAESRRAVTAKTSLPSSVKGLRPKRMKQVDRGVERSDPTLSWIQTRTSKPINKFPSLGAKVKTTTDSRRRPAVTTSGDERKELALRGRRKQDNPNQNREVELKPILIGALRVNNTEGNASLKHPSKRKYKRKIPKGFPCQKRTMQQEKSNIGEEKLFRQVINGNEHENVIQVRNVANKKRSLRTENRVSTMSSYRRNADDNSEGKVDLKPKRCRRLKKKSVDKNQAFLDITELKDHGQSTEHVDTRDSVRRRKKGWSETWTSARSMSAVEKSWTGNLEKKSAASQRNAMLRRRPRKSQAEQEMMSGSVQRPWVAELIPRLRDSGKQICFDKNQKGQMVLIARRNNDLRDLHVPVLLTQNLNEMSVVGITTDEIEAKGYSPKLSLFSKLSSERENCSNLDPQEKPPLSASKVSLAQWKTKRATKQKQPKKQSRTRDTNLRSLDLLERCMQTLELDHRAGRKPSPGSSGYNAWDNSKNEVNSATSIKTHNSINRSGDKVNHCLSSSERPLAISRQTTWDSIPSKNTPSADGHSETSCKRDSVGSRQTNSHRVRFEESTKERERDLSPLYVTLSSKEQNSNTGCTISQHITNGPTFCTPYRCLHGADYAMPHTVDKRQVTEPLWKDGSPITELAGGPKASSNFRGRVMTRHLVNQSQGGFQKGKGGYSVFLYRSIWLVVMVNFLLISIYRMWLPVRKDVQQK